MFNFFYRNDLCGILIYWRILPVVNGEKCCFCAWNEDGYNIKRHTVFMSTVLRINSHIFTNRDGNTLIKEFEGVL